MVVRNLDGHNTALFRGGSEWTLLRYWSWVSGVFFDLFRRPSPFALLHDTVGALYDFFHAFVVHTNR